MDKFTFEIELGNDAMQTGDDVAEALQSVAGLGTFFAPNTSGSIRDTDGNRVGEWRFE